MATETTNSSGKVTVVIPNWNGEAWLAPCLDALAGQDLKGFAIVVVDNGSNDGSLGLLKNRYPQVGVIELKTNRGFAAAVNAGIASCKSEYIALLNNDTRPGPHWLSSLVAAMDESEPDVGALASLMLNMENPQIVDDAGDTLSWQGSAEKRGHGRPADEFSKPEEVFSVCAGAALYRRAFFDDVGLFDERFFAYLEDIDLGLRGRLLGYRYLFVPEATVLHRGHGSKIPQGRYVRLITRNRILLFKKNLPAGLLIRHVGDIVYSVFYFLCAYRKPLHSFAGWLSVFPQFMHILRERRRILKRCKLSADQIDRLLEKKMGEPPLRQAFAKWLKP